MGVHSALKTNGNSTDGPLCWSRRIIRRSGVRALWLKNPPPITQWLTPHTLGLSLSPLWGFIDSSTVVAIFYSSCTWSRKNINSLELDPQCKMLEIVKGIHELTFKDHQCTLASEQPWAGTGASKVSSRKFEPRTLCYIIILCIEYGLTLA